MNQLLTCSLVALLSLGAVAQPPTTRPASTSRPASSGGHGHGAPTESTKTALIHKGEEGFISNIRQVTFEGLKGGEAYWSPDMKRICFQSVRGDCPHYQIYVKHLDGTSLTRISPGQGLTTCSFFHPSEDRMLWASTHLDPATFGPPPKTGGRYVWDKHESFDIFTSDTKGGRVKRLTNTPGYDAEGAYSPDGKRICFTSFRDGDFEIYTMAADGTDVRRVTHAKGYDGGPFFSPNGKQICFRGFRDPKNPRYAQLYVIDVDGKNERKLTDTPAVNWAPWWHPSGKYLIYSRNVGERHNFELFVVDTKTSKSVRITTHPGADVLPVFSPDGKKLLWTSTRGTKKSQVWLADWTPPAGFANN